MSLGGFWICSVVQRTNSHLRKPLHSNPVAVSCRCWIFVQILMLLSENDNNPVKEWGILRVGPKDLTQEITTPAATRY
jgi:hypothetical protein